MYRSTPSMKTFISWVGLSITTRMVAAADSCGALGGFASGAASCARTLGELEAVGMSEPSGDDVCASLRPHGAAHYRL